jgi:hypothetical protein
MRVIVGIVTDSAAANSDIVKPGFFTASASADVRGQLKPAGGGTHRSRRTNDTAAA